MDLELHDQSVSIGDDGASETDAGFESFENEGLVFKGGLGRGDIGFFLGRILPVVLDEVLLDQGFTVGVLGVEREELDVDQMEVFNEFVDTPEEVDRDENQGAARESDGPSPPGLE